MRVEPQPIWAHRQNKWTQLPSDELYPNDVIIL
jgi:manganese-transporting P-type ATPase